MRIGLLLFMFLVVLQPWTQEGFSAIRDFNTNEAKQQIPLTVAVKSIRDLRVKPGQHIKIGQIIAPKPLEEAEGIQFISQAPFREVTQQKQLIKELEKLKQEKGFPEIVLKHEQAILRDLEFKASEHKAKHSLPKPYKERFYKSPVNGIVQKITPLSSSNGLLSVELLVEMD